MILRSRKTLITPDASLLLISVGTEYWMNCRALERGQRGLSSVEGPHRDSVSVDLDFYKQKENLIGSYVYDMGCISVLQFWY